MIELPVLVIAVLGVFATFGFVAILGWLSPTRIKRRVIMDIDSVNNSRHLLMAALVNQAHRDGDPEF